VAPIRTIRTDWRARIWRAALRLKDPDLVAQRCSKVVSADEVRDGIQRFVEIGKVGPASVGGVGIAEEGIDAGTQEVNRLSVMGGGIPKRAASQTGAKGSCELGFGLGIDRGVYELTIFLGCRGDDQCQLTCCGGLGEIDRLVRTKVS
jgi:hypothetical protein